MEHRVSAAMTYSLHDGGFPCVQGLWYCCIRIDYPNLFVRGEVFLDLVIRFEGLADSKNKKRESELLLITQSTHHFFQSSKTKSQQVVLTFFFLFRKGAEAKKVTVFL